MRNTCTTRFLTIHTLIWIDFFEKTIENGDDSFTDLSFAMKREVCESSKMSKLG